jgi:class 3 adenylate cyclase/adenylylsulfate kinase-like enzyme
MDVEGWLQSLGLERYYQAFHDNDVDAEVLPQLTADDLSNLGVTSIGHRRKLLAAIASLRPGAVSARDPTRTGSTVASIYPASSVDAERRQLTVMFCDLVGSTAISSRLDPEDLRDVIGAYHRCVAEIVGRFDGFVGNYMGDGVLAYFGYPQAHEDDAERAVRAGLALVEAVGALKSGAASELQVRIGIGTGLVVVGDLTGSGEAKERGVVGETPNLAARLQSLAAPGTVLVSEATRRLLGTVFELESIGPQTLKGIKGTVLAYRIGGVSAVTSRFEARQAGAVIPMVGRDQELALLLDRWREAASGRGQCVLLSGEAGIGKSKIARALRDAIEGEPHFAIRYQCSPYANDSPLWPAIQQLAHAAGFAADDRVEQRLDKLESLLRQGVEDITQAAPLVAALLGVETGDRYPPLDLTPQQRRTRTLQALVDQLAGLAGNRPVLLVLEDAHWIDPTTLELMELSLDRIADYPVFVLITARPSFDNGLGSHPRVISLMLHRMEREAGEAMICRIADGKTLPREIIGEILDKADGVPLFIEELTRTVLESELVRETETGYALDGSVSSLAIPSSLHDSLVARLDRLQPIKRVAQAAACIGREFTYELLAAISPEPEAKLRHALDELAGAELIFSRGTPPAASYTFKHALVRDAAYQLLLKGQREQLHRRIAEVLQERFGDTVASQPEFLARHYTEAGLVEPAIEFWRRAGAHAVARSAHREAVGHFRRALELLGKLPPTRLRDERELELTLAFAVPLIALYGFGSTRVEGCAARAKELSDQVADRGRRFAAHKVEWNSCLLRQPVPRTVALAWDLVDLANGSGDSAQLAVAYRALGYSLFMAGELRQATDVLSRGTTLADEIPDAKFAIYGEHPSMVCRVYDSQVRCLMGYPETSARLAEAAITHARSRNNPHSLAWALCSAGNTYWNQREPGNAARLATEALELSREHRLPQWLANAEVIKGWAMCRLGDPIDGLNLQEKGVLDWHATGAVLHTTQMRGRLAESFLLFGEPVSARPHLAAARAHCERYGENYLRAELCYLEAMLSRSEGVSPEIVEQQVTKALGIAREQQARLLELRSTMMLAQLWAERGERQKACDLLAPLYASFTEGFNTEDLRRAAILCNQLG